MLIRILFAVFVLLDLAGVGLLFVLGLAAAKPSHTSPLAVARFLLVLPLLAVGVATALFFVGRSPILRGLAFALVAAPVIFLGGAIAIGQLNLMALRQSGQPVPGAMRDVEAAVVKGNAKAVADAARYADMKEPSRSGSGVLVFALRELASKPALPEVLRALLQAGSDSNASGQELPLMVAIQVSPKAGIEPVRILLEAGANPNTPVQFGEPVWFRAVGRDIDPAVLRLLLERGADVNAKRPDGRDGLASARLAQNEPAADLILKHSH